MPNLLKTYFSLNILYELNHNSFFLLIFITTEMIFMSVFFGGKGGLFKNNYFAGDSLTIIK